MYSHMYLSFLISLIFSYITLPKIIKMLEEANVVCENYKADMIPTSVGIVFVFIQVITLLTIEILMPTNNTYLIYLLGFVFIGFIGLLDDLIGEKKIKGLRGHLKSMTKGILTTGGIKAVLGFFVSLVVSIFLANSIIDIIVNSLVIALFTNFINMFDLRPGRAIKVFILISTIFIITGYFKINNYILLSLFGILIPYIPLDFKAKAMMGDVGSNILGFSLGVYTAVSFNFLVRFIILVILTITHIIAEKVSFSKIIQNSIVLKYLDDMGR